MTRPPDHDRRRSDETCDLHSGSVIDAFRLAWQQGLVPKVDDFLTSAVPDPDKLRAELTAIAEEFRRQTDATIETERSGDRASAVDETQRPTMLNASIPDDGPTQAATAGSAAYRLPDLPGYEVLAVLARGGMGIVLKARDRKLGRVVAIKMPLAGQHLPENQRERFEREARSAAGLRHPNICPIHAVGEVDGRPFIAMSFIEGPTLKQRISERPPQAREAAEIVARLARAVEFAHRHHVVHRDLKPANVMMELSTGEPILTDFGLAKETDEDQSLVTVTGEIMGTPAYMAPEQAVGNSKLIGPLTDVYALGAILYELLCGQMPFRGTVGEVLRKVQTEEPAPLRSINPRIHRDLETITLKAMAKEPHLRFLSAAELADDLERFTSGEAIHARRIGLAERAVRNIRRHPVVSTTAAVASALLVAAIYFTPQMYRSYREAQSSALQSHEIAARIRTIQGQLEQRDWNPERVAAVESELIKLAVLDKAQSQEYAGALDRRLEAFIGQRLTSPRLSVEDQKQLDQLIELLAVRDLSKAERWRAARDERLRIWEPVLELEAPFAQLATVVAPGVLSKIGEQSVRPSIENRESAGLQITPVVFNYECTTSTRVEADFENSWGDEYEIGLVLNSSGAFHGSPRALAFVNNDKQVAAGYADGAVVIWDVATRRELSSIQAHRSAVDSLAWSDKSRLLASAGLDGHVYLWDLTTGTKKHHLMSATRSSAGAFEPAWRLTFSEDGAVLATATSKSRAPSDLRLWNVATGEQTFKTSEIKDGIAAFQFLPRTNDQLLIGSHDGIAQTLDTSTGERELLWRDRRGPTTNYSGVRGLALSDDGSTVAMIGRDDVFRHIDVATGKSKWSYAIPQDGALTTWTSPDAQWMAVVRGGAVELINNFAFGRGMYFREPGMMAFSADSQKLAVGDSTGFIKICQAPSWSVRTTLGPFGYRFLASTLPPEKANKKTMPPTLDTIRKAGEGRLRLRLLRNSVLLGEQEVTVNGPQLRLTASRDGAELRWQVNDSPTLVFHDILPVDRPVGGKFSLLWPDDAHLSRLDVQHRLGALRGSPLERGDTLYAAGQLNDALTEYEHTMRTVSDNPSGPSYQREAQCKSALCLLGLNRPDEGLSLLQQIVDQRVASDHWSHIALYQLFFTRLRAGQLDEADLLMDEILAPDVRQLAAQFVSESMRRDIVAAYEPLKEPASMLLIPNVLRHYERALIVGKEFGLSDIAVVDIEALRASALAEVGRRGETTSHHAATYRGLVARQATLEHSAGGRWTWTELGRQARLSNSAKVALPVIDGVLYQSVDSLLDQSIALDVGSKKTPPAQEPFGEHRFYNPAQKDHHYRLLLERARLNATLKDWASAERDLNELKRLSSDSPPYELYAEMYLLRGFLRDRQGDPDGARREWQEGRVSVWRKTNATPLPLEKQSTNALVVSLMLDCLNGPPYTSDLHGRIGQVATVHKVTSLLNEANSLGRVTAEVLMQVSQAPLARTELYELALGNLSTARQLGLVSRFVLAGVMLQPRDLSRSNDQLNAVWRLSDTLLQMRMSGKLTPATVRQFASLLKSPSDATLSRLEPLLEPAARPLLLFVVGHRLRHLHAQPEAARKMFELALTKVAATDPLRSTLRAELQSF